VTTSGVIIYMFTGTETNTGWLWGSSFEKVWRYYNGEWKSVRRVEIRIMGTSRKLRKAAVSFANHVRLSILSHVTTRFPLEEFSWNFRRNDVLNRWRNFKFS